MANDIILLCFLRLSILWLVSLFTINIFTTLQFGGLAPTKVIIIRLSILDHRPSCIFTLNYNESRLVTKSGPCKLGISFEMLTLYEVIFLYQLRWNKTKTRLTIKIKIWGPYG